MLEVLALTGAFTAGAVAGRLVPWGQLKSLALRGFRKKANAEPAIDESQLEGQVVQGIRQHIVAETIRLRDMARSDDPAVEEAMKNMAKDFLLSNRRHF